MPYLALTATCILWGTTWVMSKAAIKNIPALELAAIRQLMAGTCFLVFFLLVKKLPLPTFAQFIRLTLMSLLMFVIANGVSTFGLKYIPTGLGALIGALYPLSVMVIEWIFYKKRDVPKITLLGMFMGLAGVAFVFYENMFAHIDSRLVIGIILSVTAMLAWSYGSIILARHPLPINPYYAMGWQMILGSTMLFIISAFSHQLISPFDISVKGWMQISYLAMIGSVFTFIAFLYTLKTLPATVSSLYAYVNPIVAIITAALFLGEKLTGTILLGTFITITGVFIVNHFTHHDEEKIIAEAEI